MTPIITDSGFGYITVEDLRIEHDIIIRLSGKIKKRRKKLSKSVYGTSHIISLEEAKHVYRDGAELLIIGSGQNGMLNISDKARDYLRKKECKIDIHPTPEAIKKWNEATGNVIGLFHITC